MVVTVALTIWAGIAAVLAFKWGERQGRKRPDDVELWCLTCDHLKLSDALACSAHYRDQHKIEIRYNN
jgi:hypothetical protein